MQGEHKLITDKFLLLAYKSIKRTPVDLDMEKKFSNHYETNCKICMDKKIY